MLYPDFNDLIAFKDRKKDLIHPFSKTVKSTVPGNHHSPFRGQGLEFDSVRAYVPGDDIRTIDWRVTARTGSAHIKLFREDKERQVLVCVDMNGYMRFGTKNTFKSIQAARTASFLGWQTIAKQDRISTCLFGDVKSGIRYFAPARGHKSFCEMLKVLSSPPEESCDISLEAAFLHLDKVIKTGSLIYIISDFMSVDEKLENNASLKSLLKRCDVVFITINDRADSSLPPVGTLGFCSPNKEPFFADTTSKEGAKAYAMQWEKNRELFHSAAKKLKIPTIELTTESDIYRDLNLGLKSIGRRKAR